MTTPEAPTRQQLYKQLREERDENCFIIRYEYSKGNPNGTDTDHVPVFAPTQEQAMQLFRDLSSNDVSIARVSEAS